jgi:hypothetical protein
MRLMIVDRDRCRDRQGSIQHMGVIYFLLSSRVVGF